MKINDFKILLREVIKDIAPNDHDCAENLAKIYKEVNDSGLNSMIYQKINNSLSYYSTYYSNKNTNNIIELQKIVLKEIQKIKELLVYQCGFNSKNKKEKR